jgi:hypothetical protein
VWSTVLERKFCFWYDVPIAGIVFNISTAKEHPILQRDDHCHTEHMGEWGCESVAYWKYEGQTVPGSRAPHRQDYHREWDSCRDKYQISSSAILYWYLCLLGSQSWWLVAVLTPTHFTASAALYSQWPFRSTPNMHALPNACHLKWFLCCPSSTSNTHIFHSNCHHKNLTPLLLGRASCQTPQHWSHSFFFPQPSQPTVDCHPL